MATSLAAADSTALPPEDARALGIIRRTLATDLRRLDPPAGTAAAPEARAPECAYDPEVVLASKAGLDSLRRRMYACYSWAQSHVLLDGDTLDRLSVLGALGRTESAERRKHLFLALDPVWRSVNEGTKRGARIAA